MIPIISAGRRKRASRIPAVGGFAGQTYPSFVDDKDTLLGSQPSGPETPLPLLAPSSSPAKFSGQKSFESHATTVVGGSTGDLVGSQPLPTLGTSTGKGGWVNPSPREVAALATFGAEWYVTYALYHISVDALTAQEDDAGGVTGFDSSDGTSTSSGLKDDGEARERDGAASYVAICVWHSMVALAAGFFLSRSQSLVPRRCDAKALTMKEKGCQTRFLWVLALVQLVGTALEHRSYLLAGSLAAESLRATETAFYLILSVALGQQRLSLASLPILLLALGMALSSVPAAGEPGAGAGWMSLGAVLVSLGSNVLLALRTVVAKVILDTFGSDEVSTLYSASKMAAVVQVLILVTIEGCRAMMGLPLLWFANGWWFWGGGGVGSEGWVPSWRRPALMALSSVSLYGNTLATLLLLSRMTGAAFIIGSGYLRAMMVFILLLFLNTSSAWLHCLGMALATVAVGLHLHQQKASSVKRTGVPSRGLEESSQLSNIEEAPGGVLAGQSEGSDSVSQSQSRPSGRNSPPSGSDKTSQAQAAQQPSHMSATSSGARAGSLTYDVKSSGSGVGSGDPSGDISGHRVDALNRGPGGVVYGGVGGSLAPPPVGTAASTAGATSPSSPFVWRWMGLQSKTNKGSVSPTSTLSPHSPTFPSVPAGTSMVGGGGSLPGGNVKAAGQSSRSDFNVTSLGNSASSQLSSLSASEGFDISETVEEGLGPFEGTGVGGGRGGVRAGSGPVQTSLTMAGGLEDKRPVPLVNTGVDTGGRWQWGQQHALPRDLDPLVVWSPPATGQPIRLKHNPDMTAKVTTALPNRGRGLLSTPAFVETATGLAKSRVSIPVVASRAESGRDGVPNNLGSETTGTTGYLVTGTPSGGQSIGVDASVADVPTPWWGGKDLSPSLCPVTPPLVAGARGAVEHGGTWGSKGGGLQKRNAGWSRGYGKTLEGEGSVVSPTSGNSSEVEGWRGRGGFPLSSTSSLSSLCGFELINKDEEIGP